MTDELATLYIQHHSSVYRFKVFTNMLMIERQPEYSALEQAGAITVVSSGIG